MWQIGHFKHLKSLGLLLYTSCLSKCSLVTYIKKQTIYNKVTCILCHVEKLTPHFLGITNKFLTNLQVYSLPQMWKKEWYLNNIPCMYFIFDVGMLTHPYMHGIFDSPKSLQSSLNKSSCVKLNTSATYMFKLNQFVNKAEGVISQFKSNMFQV